MSDVGINIEHLMEQMAEHEDRLREKDPAEYERYLRRVDALRKVFEADDLAPCPYCPRAGDVRMACTDVGRNKGFQAWCQICWAHGPSRPTEAEAREAWDEVSLAMRGEELTPGQTYVLTQDCDGNKAGQYIVFRWRTEDGKFNIFNPEGEADMQSAFSIKGSKTEDYVAADTREGLPGI